jgi:hypothetical protein
MVFVPEPIWEIPEKYLYDGLSNDSSLSLSLSLLSQKVSSDPSFVRG